MKRINWIEEHPVEAVIFVFSFCLFFYAAFVLTPWYLAATGNAIATSFPMRWQELIIAGSFLVSSVPGLIAPFNKKIPNVFLELGTLGICLSFLFLTILRVALYGWIPFTWLAFVAISVSSGILRIYLRSHRS